MTKKILVGMSGGVDSSVATYLLTKQGYEVTGVFIRNGVEVEDSTQKSCCSVDDSYDARRVADKLDIPFYSINLKDTFQSVINYFIDEYNRGRTPNPCAMCNRQIKFGTVFDYADTLGCDIVATGHYARLERDENGSPLLKKGIDKKKDQSYFLFDIKREKLDRIMFPIGDMTKDQIRAIAREAELPVVNKPESQQICFVPNNDYRELLKNNNVQMKEGNIVTTDGETVGKHKGHQMFTVGQREGLGVALGKPKYVIDIKPDTNSIVIGDNERLMKKKLKVTDINWLITPPNSAIKSSVKIRYNSRDVSSTINIDPQSSRTCEVIMDDAVRAVTPGQAAVFYDGDTVLGGGWIATIDGQEAGLGPAF